MTRPSYVPAPVADDLAAQDAALDNPNPCPICSAGRDSYCVNPLTGTFLHNRVSHWQRIPRQVAPVQDATTRAREEESW